MFRTIWDIDREWMPEVRVLIAEAQARGARVFRLATLEELNSFQASALAN
jgi:hypothetical protein